MARLNSNIRLSISRTRNIPRIQINSTKERLRVVGVNNIRRKGSDITILGTREGSHKKVLVPVSVPKIKEGRIIIIRRRRDNIR
jgi:hypothetical protein